MSNPESTNSGPASRRAGGIRLWLVLIPCSYVAILVVLSIPALHLAMETKTYGPFEWRIWLSAFSSSDLVLTTSPWFLTWLVVTTLAQVALLLPAGRAAERPRGRRRLWCAIAAAAFLAGALTAGLVFAICFGVWGDDFDLLDASGVPLPFLPDDAAQTVLFVAPILAGWGLWWIVLLKATRAGPGTGFAARACRWLLAGSALELIVAVPCHVISRQRGDCCAPLGTFYGIAAGVSVAILCCGPALLYLVRDRVRRKAPRAS
jgi:hypothetical protein